MGAESLRDILARPAPDALSGFMARWSGSLRPPEPEDDGVPRALRLVYRAFGHAPDAFAVNRLLRPSELVREGGFTVFYVEEQAVYLWAVADGELEADDPPVWCRENDPRAEWVMDAPRVTVFMVQMAVMSAALGGPFSAAASWISSDAVARALAPLTELDLPPWHWPGHPARWYAGEDAVAFVCPNYAAGDSAFSVWVSALSEAALRFLEPHVDRAWEYYSPRDG